jgi:hypothetical protein
MAVQQLSNHSLTMREPLRKGFSMPPLEHADSVYKALNALKREFDSAPSLRSFEEQVRTKLSPALAHRLRFLTDNRPTWGLQVSAHRSRGLSTSCVACSE